jgi:hypothetical protein
MNDEEMRRATDRGRPGDLMWGGLAACLVGVVVASVALTKDHPTTAVVAISVFGVVAQVLIGIAVVAFGVSLGIRHAEAKSPDESEMALTQIRTLRRQAQADKGDEGPVPPWDTPEGRSYR